MMKCRYGWPLLLLVLLLAGCSGIGRKASLQGEESQREGDFDQAVSSYLQAVEAEPKSHEYRMQLQRARGQAALMHKKRGAELIEQGEYAKAIGELQLAVSLDGSLETAAEQMLLARNHLQAERLVAEAEQLFRGRRLNQARNALDKALLLVPGFASAEQLLEKIRDSRRTVIDGVELEVTSDEPITLNFKEAKLPDVFDILTELAGINFILDEEIRSESTTLYLEGATFAQALELLLRMNKLDKKILNPQTIILFPKTRDKQKQFADQLIQTFYLSNIDAKKAVNLLRTMLQIRKIYVHEELNAIVLRDRPEVVRLAQKIIEANDRANSEVIFDLELVEISHSDDSDYGFRLSSNLVGAGLAADGATTIAASGVSATADVSGLLPSFDKLDPFYGIPTASFSMIKTLSDTEILASPKIRVKNKEKAKVHIGSREPVVTVTSSGTDQISENVQYVDVGVKLDVEPVIQLDNSIVTKLGLEVSNVSDRTETSNKSVVLTISTTNANTTLTLKDGEQTIIGGLLRDDVTVSKNKIPLLSDIPLLGRLFTGTKKDKSKREILLSITPHIVKSVNLPRGVEASIWSGGEDDLKAGKNFGSFADEYRTGQTGIKPPAVPAKAPAPRPAAEKVPPQAPSTEAAPAVESFEQVVRPQPTVAPSLPTPPPVPVPEPPSEPPRQVEIPAGQSPQPVERIAEVSLPGLELPPAVANARLFLQGSTLVKVGEQFSITAMAEEVEELFSAPLYVRYNAELVEFVAAEEASFLKQGESPTIFTSTALAGNGRLIVGLKQGGGGKGVSGGGELFRMTFKAKAAGIAEIIPERVNFRNPRGDRLKVDASGLKVEIGD